MSDVAFTLGVLTGAVIWDVLWRITNRLTAKLVDEQRKLITEQQGYIQALRDELRRPA